MYAGIQLPLSGLYIPQKTDLDYSVIGCLDVSSLIVVTQNSKFELNHKFTLVTVDNLPGMHSTAAI